MIYAAILAGGSGTRMGNTDRPKQFLEVGGKPIIVRTVEAFACCEEIDRVLVVTPAQWVEYTGKILSEHLGVRVECAGDCHYQAKMHPDKMIDCYDAKTDNGVGATDASDSDVSRAQGTCTEKFVREDSLAIFTGGTRITVLAGGDTRNETLMNAIRLIDAEGNLNDDTIIITQDAVRPFAGRRMILENIEAARRTGACETAFPATDTIIESDDGRLVGMVPDRSRLWMTQTPQSFRAKKLRDLYESLTEREKEVLTDAAKIFVIKGEPVEIVMGESYNIKITYPEDIGIAEAIVARLQKGC